ncbi:MAG: glycosyltransferase family 4 protein [Acidimicrobiia bacterium]|nr:glycosyltransferase family 4 protein [Acidimicrobiia bacterium]
MADRSIFQLGTNNWQRDGEFAPGSGILHEAHHRAFDALPGVSSYSMYPSRVQRFDADDVRVFELDHDIPICESVSPVSSYRWHAMSDADLARYRRRLTTEVAAWMTEIETRTGNELSLAIAHHTFLNPVVLRDVIRDRAAAGRRPMPLVCFAHGTALKMYANERAGHPEFPARFLPYMRDEGVFDLADGAGHVDLCAAISSQQVEALLDVFPEFPRDRVVLSPNGYNQDVFTVSDATYDDRSEVLGRFATVDGRPIDTDVDHVVVFCGKFADWKRLDALLHAASGYEATGPRIATVIVGSGPRHDQERLRSLAYDELGLRRTYFVGPRAQHELATIFNCADVGCFPSRDEPFGLVFIECMACGTPVIGADSGGPRDFVTDAVGTLVPESDDIGQLATSLRVAITRALEEDWKTARGRAASVLARERFSVQSQVSDLLDAVDDLQEG